MKVAVYNCSNTDHLLLEPIPKFLRFTNIFTLLGRTSLATPLDEVLRVQELAKESTTMKLAYLAVHFRRFRRRTRVQLI